LLINNNKGFSDLLSIVYISSVNINLIDMSDWAKHKIQVFKIETRIYDTSLVFICTNLLLILT